MRPEALAGLTPHRTALFLDVDGTLLDFAAAPHLVMVPPSLVKSLQAVERGIDGALALVSGRRIADLDQLFRPLRLRASGVHGAEIRYFPSSANHVSTQSVLPETSWLELNELLQNFPGALAENKSFSFAVHYRNFPDALGPLFDALARFVQRYPSLHFELLHGHMVVELKLPGFDKGKAIELFMARPPFAGRRPVFLADDELDWGGFNAVLAMEGIAISVGKQFPGVSGWFATPAAVRSWLAGFCQ